MKERVRYAVGLDSTVDKLIEAVRRETAKSFGACMSCFDGAPEPFGCTDCLNTGYVGGAPPGYVSEETYNEARLDAAKAMRERCKELAERMWPEADDLHDAIAALPLDE